METVETITRTAHQEKPQVGEVWRHWKGNHYRILMLAKLEATQEKAVVYADIHDASRLDGYSRPWVRPLKEWCEEVFDILEDDYGRPDRQISMGPRFVKVLEAPEPAEQLLPEALA